MPAPKPASSRRPALGSAAPVLGLTDAGLPAALLAAEEPAPAPAPVPAPAPAAGAWALTEAACRQQRPC